MNDEKWCRDCSDYIPLRMYEAHRLTHLVSHEGEDPSLFDDYPVTPTKHLARTGDPDTSHDAAASIQPTVLELMVLADIVQAGVRGCTQDELRALHPDMSYSSITARPAALKAKGLIGYSGEKRAGVSGRQQRVLVAAKHLTSEPHDNPSTSPSPVPPIPAARPHIHVWTWASDPHDEYSQRCRECGAGRDPIEHTCNGLHPGSVGDCLGCRREAEQR